MRPSSTPPPAPDEWEEIVRLVRLYARRKYGWPPVAITLHSPYQGVEHREPLTAPDIPGPPSGTPRIHEWASGSEPRHLTEFRSIYWPGLGRFNLTETQAKITAQLWEAMEDGTWEVQQSVLLRRAQSESPRLVDVFKKSPAWGTLIVAGQAAGTYRLAPLPVTPENDPEED